MTSAVTRHGLEGVRRGRDAMTGVNARSRREKRRTGGEQPVVPKAEFTSYYGLPILNGPVWKRTDIAGYFFAGGLAGASSVLAAGAQLTAQPELAKRAKIVATGSVAIGAAGLVHDLGRPSRFANMLRVFKPSSPMSVGSWLLSAYAPAAIVAAMTSVTGRWSRVGVAATAGATVLGPLISTYTAALVSDTAVPAWHDGYREMPFLFAGSSATAAGGAALVTSPVAYGTAPLRFAICGAALELVASEAMKKRLGMVAEPYSQGTAGRYMKLGRALTVGGLAVALFGRHQRIAAVVGGAALVTASACTRIGVFEAGIQSADDPKYIVEPQRQRLAAQT
jgi:formate-dependent nitrite reductase membrane component NrfD